MGDNDFNIVVKNTDRYKGAPDSDYSVQTTLLQTQKLYSETDRTVSLSLSELFDRERQSSTTFRPTFKIDYLYKNNYSGTTKYFNYRDNLLIVDGEYSLDLKLSGKTETWYGVPQFQEFSLIRNDYTNPQVQFEPKMSSKYNFSYYLSYPYSSVTQTPMSWYSQNGIFLLNFVASDGIPCSINNTTINGSRYIQFTCPVNHGLSVGEYVKFPFSYNNIEYFQVDALGDERAGSDLFIFNIANPGFTGATFFPGSVTTFKRVLTTSNVQETTSRYYVRMHRLLTNYDDLVLERAGFDNNPFPNYQQYEFSSLTPNNVARISKLTNSQSYSVTTSFDLDLNNVLDENQKPIDHIYLSFFVHGRYGWFDRILKKGWLYNITSESVSPWWDHKNTLSDEVARVFTYQKTQSGSLFDFYYFDYLQKPTYDSTGGIVTLGDDIMGDWVEYNDYEMSGRTISPYTHKFTFNQKLFNSNPTVQTRPEGYYYQVHHPMRIKQYSTYVEEGIPNQIVGVPKYSFYSQNTGFLRWRDIYTYGYIDTDGFGVDYPFINETHYPYANVFFKLIPEGADLGLAFSDIVLRPTTDECE